jgi:PHO85 cyclin-5
MRLGAAMAMLPSQLNCAKTPGDRARARHPGQHVHRSWCINKIAKSTLSTASSVSRCAPTFPRPRRTPYLDANPADAAALIVEAVWPLSSVVCRNELNNKVVLPLRTFIQETLKRSRTSYSTLQVTMYYLVLIKGHVPKHDFTMEQPSDLHATRALQCGRRVFLAALILASKYLQDRTYTCRAWSKISGLNTNEINQNEMAFLHAVNWNLHITDVIWQRWTKILLNYRPPPSPPSPSSHCSYYQQQCAEWKTAMLKLDAELVNIDALLPFARTPSQTIEVSSPMAFDGSEPPLTPTVMEPNPATVYTPGRNVPALGLLPTPKLTPQLGGFGTPAVGTVSHLLTKSSAMGAAMHQANGVSSAQFMDRWPASIISSPQVYLPTRRSSLAAYSTASSPESMISDVSRSSSISSASSLGSATSLNVKLSAVSRFRVAKLLNERPTLRPLIISTVPEDYEQACLTSSPDTYAGPTGKLAEMTMETPLGRRERELEDIARESANDAARTLQEMHDGYVSPPEATTPVRAGSKRSRSNSLEASLLQENVREILSGRSQVRGLGWPETMVRTRFSNPEMRQTLQVPVSVPTLTRMGSKRLCCSAEVSQQELGRDYLHPGMGGMGRPGMWTDILP